MRDISLIPHRGLLLRRGVCVCERERKSSKETEVRVREEGARE